MLYYAIECTRDLRHCFPDVNSDFSEVQQGIILQMLEEISPEDSRTITDDDLTPFETADDLQELASNVGLDYDDALRSVYEDYATEDDFPELDEDGEPTGEVLPFDDLTDDQKQTFADDNPEDILRELRHHADREGITIWETEGTYMSWNPNR